jgi:general secretion pathway protein K
LGDSARDTEPAVEWLPNGVPHPWTFDDTALSITVFNEASRINLNQATPQVLGALLAALGADEAQAGQIADAIADWRDEDDLKLLNGAEDPDYAQAGRPLGAKDAPFVAVEELQQVLGVTPELYARLAPELTVDTESDEVDQTFASAAVLAAVQGIGLAEAERQIEQRDHPTLPGGQTARTANRGGPLYRIQVREQGGGTVRAMEALIALSPDQPRPYQVRWQRFGQLAAPPSAASTGAGG